LLIRVLCLTAGVGLLGGCTVYPMSRTFYEPTSAEGKLRNQPGCRFLHTHDTVQTRVGDIDVSVMVGAEREPADRQPDLSVTVTIEGPAGSWELQTDKVTVVLERSGAILRRDLATDFAAPHGTRWTLHYPEPAGSEDRVEIRFEPGALVIGGAAVEVAPLHFRRVRKSDVYVGTINC
jgi:hypothetical protein